MTVPRKAIVLAAGLGTRMHPLTVHEPKPLLPLWGKPIIGHVFDMLLRWGVREVLVNLHSIPSPIVEYLRASHGRELRISFSFEPQILGTGGCVARGSWFLDSNPFWMVNADIAVDISRSSFTRALNTGNHLAALLMTDQNGPRTVAVKDGVVTDFRSAEPCSQGTFTFCGIHLVSPRICDHIPAGHFSTIIEAYEAAMRSGETISAVSNPGTFWFDMGSPTSYLNAHTASLRRLGTPAPGHLLAAGGRKSLLRKIGFSVARGNGVRLSEDVQLTNSVLMANVCVENGAVLRNAIVGRDCIVRGNVSGIAVRGDRTGDHALETALECIGWLPRNTTVISLGARGSARSFVRVLRGKRSLIGVRYSMERRENGLFVQNADFLRRLGLRVPRIIFSDKRTHTILQEDVGDCSLDCYIAGMSNKQIAKIYRKVLCDVALLHSRTESDIVRSKIRLSGRFTSSLYRWERELFVQHMLLGRLKISRRRVDRISTELVTVARLMASEPRVLVHRDLQSSNILIRRNTPVFIDFQGMRIGAAAYDLASLLCDPYVSLSEHLQRVLVAYYGDVTGQDVAEVERSFWVAAIQRLVQALGAFGRLSELPAVQGFDRHIVPAMKMLARAIRCATLHSELSCLADLLSERLEDGA